MRIRKKKCLKNCKNSCQFVIFFLYGILVALCTVQSASSDWMHLCGYTFVSYFSTQFITSSAVQAYGFLIFTKKKIVVT